MQYILSVYNDEATEKRGEVVVKNCHNYSNVYVPALDLTTK